MPAKAWSTYVTYEQPRTEKMIPGISRMAFRWDPAPNDASASWFPCGPRLRKDTCSRLVKKSSSHRPKQDPGLFLLFMRQKVLSESRIRVCAYDMYMAFLHEGIWHLKLTCLSKPHQAPGAPKKPGLAPAMCMLSCPQHWQKQRSDNNRADPIQHWCCKV